MFNFFQIFSRRPLHSLTVEEVARAHEEGTEHALMHGSVSSQYVGDFVFGGIDGVITTFAVVAGVAGAHLAPHVVLIAGIASLLADGFAMGVGNFLSARSTLEHYEQERRREQWEVEHIPEHERQEIYGIYQKQGFSGDVLEGIVRNITSDKERWIETMMREELGLSRDDRSAIRAGLVTFVSFVVIGSIPLLSYVAAVFAPSLISYTFIISILLTGVALFIIGAAKTVVTGQPLLRSGLEILGVGSVVALVAYLVGYFLRDLRI